MVHAKYPHKLHTWGDMNGFVGEHSWRLWIWYEKWREYFRSTQSYDWLVLNMWYRNRENHVVTYRSGSNATHKLITSCLEDMILPRNHPTQIPNPRCLNVIKLAQEWIQVSLVFLSLFIHLLCFNLLHSLLAHQHSTIAHNQTTLNDSLIMCFKKIIKGDFT